MSGLRVFILSPALPPAKSFYLLSFPRASGLGWQLLWASRHSWIPGVGRERRLGMWLGGWQNPGEWNHDLKVMSPGVAPFPLLLASKMAQTGTEGPPLTPP